MDIYIWNMDIYQRNMEYGYISTKLKMAKKIIKQKHQQQWFINVENLMKSVLFLTVSMSNLRSLTNVSAFSHFLQFLQVIFTQIHYSSWLMDWLNWLIDWPVSSILSRVFDALWIWQSWPRVKEIVRSGTWMGYL